MRYYNTITGHSPVGEAAWIIAGIIVMFAFGDAFVLSALAFGLVTVIGALFTHRRAEQRAQMASVTQLRTAPTADRGLKSPSTQMQWHGPSAAA
jgi:hypothetical protein